MTEKRGQDCGATESPIQMFSGCYLSISVSTEGSRSGEAAGCVGWAQGSAAGLPPRVPAPCLSTNLRAQGKGDTKPEPPVTHLGYIPRQSPSGRSDVWDPHLARTMPRAISKYLGDETTSYTLCLSKIRPF